MESVSRDEVLYSDAEIMKTFWGVFTKPSVGKSQPLWLRMQSHVGTWKILQIYAQFKIEIFVSYPSGGSLQIN